jgi:hypothetical protein
MFHNRSVLVCICMHVCVYVCVCEHYYIYGTPGHM